MDNHPSFWYQDLESLVKKLDVNDQILFKYKFVSPEDNETYYSVFTHICEWTWAEFFSSDIGSMSSDDFTETDVPRMVFTDWNQPS